MVLLAVACIAGLVVGAIAIDQRNEDTESATADSSDDDPRIAAIEGFCDDPRPLTDSGPIPTFTPGQGTIGFMEVPTVASSPQPDQDVVVQVSPVVGTPNLTLEGSVNLLSLAVCVDEAGSTATTGRCDYELTNPDAFGERTSARLRETTFDISLRELRTGKALATGSLKTPVERCPEFAYVDPGAGVSNSLTTEQVLAWVAVHLPNGQPS